MKLIQTAMFALAVSFAAPAMACDCAKNACAKDKDGKMACTDKDKKTCGCEEGKECKCDKKEEKKKAS